MQLSTRVKKYNFFNNEPVDVLTVPITIRHNIISKYKQFGLFGINRKHF